MDTSREDVVIAIRSAFLKRGTQQRFSLFVLVIISAILIFLDTIEAKPLNKVRTFFKDIVYRSAVIVSYPLKSFSSFYDFLEGHANLYSNYKELKCAQPYFSYQILGTYSKRILYP